MSLDPKNYRTWDRLDLHPVFGPDRSNIASWSYDPSQYSSLTGYGVFLPEWYVHVDPAPPVHVQIATAKRDLENLASACREIEKAFADIRYELVVLDDFTTYVWVRHARFEIELYPGLFGEETVLKMFVERPRLKEEEFDFVSVSSVIQTLSDLLSNT
ncbi:hypothetical protein NG895_14930 [Aeoliella sp. ICT_H6.2]|uniref:Uncharacterized protein n=1 Tax=Aeoliella straminimaris TaxID=2954799 RepID=A0A9X2FAZ3_9BACT|nr:hypothetical protein [Aeoliella straminimaris]MCO6045204.1 hypothetical protein [Aeoliella straminimaris]